MAGRQGKCPGCGDRVTVPPAETASPFADPPATKAAMPPVAPPIAPPVRVVEQPRDVVEYAPAPPVQPPVAVQLNVSQSNTAPSNASSSLGIASLVIGVLSLFTFCIPLVGLLVSLLGLGLGAAGLTMAILRKGRGIGFSIAGIVLSGISLLIALFFMFAMSAGVTAMDQAIKEAEARQKTQQNQRPPAPQAR